MYIEIINKNNYFFKNKMKSILYIIIFFEKNSLCFQKSLAYRFFHFKGISRQSHVGLRNHD
jgi:hypothetical protein